jgi:NAD(P)-dependent dehydrogenase (short-subunit alcohol dehydrogenase family)
MGLEGKVAIVTGGARGLGRAIALELAAEGAKVVIADINQEEAKRVVEKVQKSGGTAVAIQVDVSNSAQVQAMVDGVIGESGRIDILMNNAGIVGPQGPWAELSEEGFDMVVGINFKGVFLCSRAVIPYMMEQNEGKIIITSSCAGKTGEQFNGVYSATKGAIWNMTQSLAKEVGCYNINVNAICPAAMNTDMMETVYRERSAYFGINPEELREKIRSSFVLPRELTVEDTAHLAVFLASDKANMMTGQGVNITGGIEMH